MLVDQPNTGGGHVMLSVPVKLTLRSGANTVTIGSGQTSKSSLKIYFLVLSSLTFLSTDYAADLDKIVVYTAT